MRWDCTKVELGDTYRYNLNFHFKNAWDGKEYPTGSVYFQGWGFGACSTNFLWNWYSIPKEACCEESLAGFIEAYRSAQSHSHWNAHMFMCQIPADSDDYLESMFFKYFRETIYPDIKPVFVYENRAHESSLQRLYYFDTDVMFNWQGAYHAKQREKNIEAEIAGQNTRAAVCVPDNAEPQRGTIIEPIQYFR